MRAVKLPTTWMLVDLIANHKARVHSKLSSFNQML